MQIETSRGVTERGLDHYVVRWIMSQVGNPNISIRLWNGDEFPVTEARPVACMELRARRAILELLRSSGVGFGESYSKGLIEIHGDFPAFVNEITAALTRKKDRRYYGPKIRSIVRAISANSHERSRHNVHHHYDLGNDFYKLWLDEHMVYTCAYYDTPAATLAEAQVAKLEHVCRKLNLQPGQTVIEAGCGWGALSMYMAEHYGVNVIAYNLSGEQVRFARERATAKGLDDRVTFVHEDYRRIDQECDRFVSIGMLEHVGLANFSRLGALIKSSLKPEGFGLIHSIGRSHPDRTDAWITKHIFPGGHIPSLSEMMKVFEPHRFSLNGRVPVRHLAAVPGPVRATRQCPRAMDSPLPVSAPIAGSLTCKWRTPSSSAAARQARQVRGSFARRGWTSSYWIVRSFRVPNCARAGLHRRS
jgi:cyclopropane-fatty-acyl-phospholipid synthase